MIGQYEDDQRRHAAKVLASRRNRRDKCLALLDDTPRRWGAVRIMSEARLLADEYEKSYMTKTADILREMARRIGVYSGMMTTIKGGR